ncbi:hypothetical protein GQR58_016108 [Nymphon striatum]|nr:hypothetical protein GQR58_016108 [Nymphon striatum]
MLVSQFLLTTFDYNGNRRVITDIDYIYCVNYGTDMDLLSSENEVHQITTSVTNCSQNKVVTGDKSPPRGGDLTDMSQSSALKKKQYINIYKFTTTKTIHKHLQKKQFINIYKFYIIINFFWASHGRAILLPFLTGDPSKALTG